MIRRPKFGNVKVTVDGLIFDKQVEKFWSRIDQSGGPDACWRWQARSRDLNGYGMMQFNMGLGTKNYGAHRIAFFLANGRMQGPGLQVMHSCDQKDCCNPKHLAEGTRSQNMKDAYERGRIKNPNKPKGEAHPFATVTAEQVSALRRLREGGAKRQDLAIISGLSLGGLDNLLSRRSWKSVP